LLSKACGDDEMDGEKTKKIDRIKATFETKKVAPKRGNLRAFMKARIQQPKEDDFGVVVKENVATGLQE
jgi:hypothetical protein